jgi:PAS domain S-box-containing protein
MTNEDPTKANGVLARDARVRFLAVAFRRILLVVLLIFVFAIVQMFTLWAVCETGMKTAQLLEHEGLPSLNELASLQENLASYRLHSYEYLFAQKPDRAARKQAAETDAQQIRMELKNILTLFPEGDGRQLAANLEMAVDDLAAEFRMVRDLTDSDFNAAMNVMDQEIPPRTERVAAAAQALKDFGYRFSGGQASATFGSFSWIKTNAVFFGVGNILVAFGAVMFVLVAARRSRAQVSETLARLEERTHELQNSNAGLLLKETELQALFDFLPAILCFKDTQNRFLRVNQRLADSLGKSVAEIEGRAGAEIYPHDAAKFYKDDSEVIRSGVAKLGIVETFQDHENKTVWVQTDKIPVSDRAGKIIGIIVMCQDITTRKRLEEQLIQSQRMESIGKLAGGIAHEFNSLLTAVLGHCEMLLTDLPAGSPLLENATEINQAAGRAAGLTRQLLAYGRKQFLKPELLDLNRVMENMQGVFKSLLGGVDIQIIPAGLGVVRADAGQIEQVILNLVINAREAMPSGGKLTLETADVTLDQIDVGRQTAFEMKAGRYVMLAVTDTGVGMNETVKARLFEPFFSTKRVGEGAGLGLSTCYGIVKQSGGHISVYSELARGTTFKIYLPQVESAATLQPLPRANSTDLPRGTETILLVEDDAALRTMATSLLHRLGYTVLAAASGLEALKVKQGFGTRHIDLLFTDLVMPHMGGKELADRVRSISPQIKILFTSAYTENAIAHQGALDTGAMLLQKPFTPAVLAHKLRAALDQTGVTSTNAGLNHV